MDPSFATSFICFYSREDNRIMWERIQTGPNCGYRVPLRWICMFFLCLSEFITNNQFMKQSFCQFLLCRFIVKGQVSVVIYHNPNVLCIVIGFPANDNKVSFIAEFSFMLNQYNTNSFKEKKCNCSLFILKFTRLQLWGYNVQCRMGSATDIYSRVNLFSFYNLLSVTVVQSVTERQRCRYSDLKQQRWKS